MRHASIITVSILIPAVRSSVSTSRSALNMLCMSHESFHATILLATQTCHYYNHAQYWVYLIISASRRIKHRPPLSITIEISPSYWRIPSFTAHVGRFSCRDTAVIIVSSSLKSFRQMLGRSSVKYSYCQSCFAFIAAWKPARHSLGAHAVHNSNFEKKHFMALHATTSSFSHFFLRHYSRNRDTYNISMTYEICFSAKF